MSTTSQNKPRHYRKTLLLAAVILVAGVAGLVKLRTAAPGPGQLAATGGESPARATPTDPAERLFLTATGATSSRSRDNIADAFNSEILPELTLEQIECRGRICKVVFDGTPGDKVQTRLASALADSFNAMVTVHSSTGSSRETLLYVEIPPGR